MIKASIQTKTGGTLLLLGLSDENIRRLTKDEPVLVRPEDVKTLLGNHQLEGLVIFHGATEADIKASMVKHGLIGEETRYA